MIFPLFVVAAVLVFALALPAATSGDARIARSVWLAVLVLALAAGVFVALALMRPGLFSPLP